MFVLILSIMSLDIDTQGVSTVTSQTMSSKRACYAAGRLFEKQHRREYVSLRWSCTPQ